MFHKQTLYLILNTNYYYNFMRYDLLFRKKTADKDKPHLPFLIPV